MRAPTAAQYYFPLPYCITQRQNDTLEQDNTVKLILVQMVVMTTIQ